MKTTVGLVAIVGRPGTDGAHGVVHSKASTRWTGSARVSFPISCKPAVQKPFDQAVAILATRSGTCSPRRPSRPSPRTDPRLARSAYWGIAMSQWYQILVSSEPGPPSSEAVEAMGEGPRNRWATPTPRERDYIAAADAFFREAARFDHRTRAAAYEKAMEQVFNHYPQDREAQAFYALALLATADPRDRTYAKQEAIGGGSPRRSSRRSPIIPAPRHYIIHAYDYPRPWRSGRCRAAAPLCKVRSLGCRTRAPHAVAHLRCLLGMWPEDHPGANIAAAAAAERKPAAIPMTACTRSTTPRLRVSSAGPGWLTPSASSTRRAGIVSEPRSQASTTQVPRHGGLRHGGHRGALDHGARTLGGGPRPSSLGRIAFPHTESMIYFARGHRGPPAVVRPRRAPRGSREARRVLGGAFVLAAR